VLSYCAEEPIVDPVANFRCFFVSWFPFLRLCSCGKNAQKAPGKLSFRVRILSADARIKGENAILRYNSAIASSDETGPQGHAKKRLSGRAIGLWAERCFILEDLFRVRNKWNE
jgi:hypothetical protein